MERAEGLADIEQRLRDLLSERRAQKRSLRIERREIKRRLREEKASGLLRRRELLRYDWRAMRGDDWENYLVEVLRALGVNAQRTRLRASSDQGVDIIVDFGEYRVAIQAKGYDQPVGNFAVQEVYAGASHWNCVAFAVITNSRFTRKAIELGTSTGCILIGENEFVDFVTGRFDLRSHAEQFIQTRKGGSQTIRAR